MIQHPEGEVEANRECYYAPPTPAWLDSAGAQAPGFRPFMSDRRQTQAPRTLPFSEKFCSAPTHNAAMTNAAARIHFQKHA